MEIGEKLICCNCVGSTGLSKIISAKGKRKKCLYCRNINQSITLNEFTDIVEKTFAEHFRQTLNEPTSLEERLINDKESDYSWEPEGEPFVYALANTALLDDPIALDVQKILEDRYTSYYDYEAGHPYDDNSYYEMIEFHDPAWDTEFEEIQESIRTQRRHFNSPVKKFLDLVFGGITSLKTRNDKPIIIEAGPGFKIASLHRARVLQSDSKLLAALENPEDELGPPPPRLATAGRMNASGVSVFYGAINPEISISEVRPPITSFVLLGEFNIVRKLKLLNIDGLRDTFVRESIFDTAYKTKLREAYFVKRISNLMARPILPGEESFEYILTQVVADYIADYQEIKFDGILYPSVQSSRSVSNVVLFHDASRIKDPETVRPFDVQLYHPEEGGYDIMIQRKYHDDRKNNFFSSNAFAESEDSGSRNADPRLVTLELDVKSLHVKQIKGIAYDQRDLPVT